MLFPIIDVKSIYP